MRYTEEKLMEIAEAVYLVISGNLADQGLPVDASLSKAREFFEREIGGVDESAQALEALFEEMELTKDPACCEPLQGVYGGYEALMRKLFVLGFLHGAAVGQGGSLPAPVPLLLAENEESALAGKFPHFFASVRRSLDEVEKLAEIVRKRRGELGWSVEELAQRSFSDPTQVRLVEEGKALVLNFLPTMRLVRALGLEMSDLPMAL